MDYHNKRNKIIWRCNENSKCLARCFTIGLVPPVVQKILNICTLQKLLDYQLERLLMR